MNFLFKFIPINILYVFRIDQLFILRRQFTVHAVYGIIAHPRWLAANTVKVLAASQRGCMINAIDCMYVKLAPEDE